MHVKIGLEFSWESPEKGTGIPVELEEELMTSAMRQVAFQLLQGKADGTLVETHRLSADDPTSLREYAGRWSLLSGHAPR